MVVSNNLKPENPLRNLLLPSHISNLALQKFGNDLKFIPNFIVRWLFWLYRKAKGAATIVRLTPHSVAQAETSNFVEFGFRISQVPRLPDECR